ncbi:MAG: hypothetical protein GY856_24360 [bacterium]|nr:hypothetical protein [bacterium]
MWGEVRERLERRHPWVGEAASPLYLLDRQLRLVPLGGQGEIDLEGIGAAAVDGPAAAAATWRPHPFADEPGARLVATGLRGRRRAPSYGAPRATSL